MNENEFYYEENDFGDLCGLVDIFPDIEPFLKDVTKSFETAKADLDKKKVDGHVDGSDSDSGISADSYVNGALITPDFLLSDSLPSHEKISKLNNCVSVVKPENSKLCLSNENKLVKRPISFISKKGLEVKQHIYNIIPKVVDSDYQNSKPNFIKSHSVSIKTVETKKDLQKTIPKITPIKLLKSNDGFPVIVSDSNSKKEPITYYEIKNSAIKQIKLNETPNKTAAIKNENDSCYDLFSSKNSISDNNNNNNIFLKEDSINDDLSSFPSYHDFDLYENKDESSFMDISMIDDYKSPDCPSYIDIYNANQGNKVTQSSSIYKTLSNCDGVLDAHHYDRMVKKQERMIKNRQAASLSRQRKKEYVERLEHKVEQQKQENHFLQSQINDIRERFSALEQDNQLLKRDIQTWRERYYDLERQKVKQGINNFNKYENKVIRPGPETINKSKALKATAASTTILGIFIILTFNFNSLNSIVSSFYKAPIEKNIPIFKNDYPIIPSSFSGKQLVNSDSRIGRTLFSILENATESEALNSHICNNTSGLNINETLRLTRELNSWGLRFKAESVKVYDRLQNAKLKSQIFNKEFESIYKKSKFRDNTVIMNKMKRKREMKSGQLEIYPRIKDYTLFDNFINDIDRQPDTLYFVTFHSDNFIFPASNVNKNLSSPKITLFLPADIYQADKNNYKMMKIECQVQNFTIVNLSSVKMP